MCKIVLHSMVYTNKTWGWEYNLVVEHSPGKREVLGVNVSKTYMHTLQNKTGKTLPSIKCTYKAVCAATKNNEASLHFKTHYN